MAVSLRLLRVFLAVSREGNIGRTAASLYVSQPSLSQDIRRLERELGAQLFIRGPQGMTLTPAGEGFRRDVEDALALLDRGVERVKAEGKGRRRRVVIGFSPSFGHHFMPTLIPTLEERFPNVVVDEREVDTGAVGPGVRSGQFHLGIGHCLEADDGFRVETIGLEPLAVAVAADHPLVRRGTPIQLSDLCHLPLMLWARDLAPRYHDALVDICRRSGLEPRIVAGPRRAMIRSYEVSEGKVFCLLPRSTSTLAIRGVAFVDVSDDHAVVAVDAIRRDRREPDEVETIWQALVDEGARV